MRLRPLGSVVLAGIVASHASAQCPLSSWGYGAGAIDHGRAAVPGVVGNAPGVRFFVKSDQGWQDDGAFVLGDMQIVYWSPVAIQGDRALAASPESNSQAGRVWAFDRVGAQWVPTEIVSPSVGFGDFFGTSLALDGDTAVVGADHWVVGGGDGIPVIHVFERAGAAWVEVAVLPITGFASGGWMPIDVDGSTFVVASSGRVWIYERIAGSWAFSAEIPPTGPGFGSAIALQGDRLAVGGGQGGSNPGFVEIYRKQAGVWQLVQHIVPSDAVNGDRFGNGVAFWGTTLLVGATAKDAGLGRVYRFEHDGVAFVERSSFGPAPGMSSFGQAVAVHREDALLAGFPGGIAFYRLGFAEQSSFCPTTPNSTGFAGTLAAEGCDSLSGSRFTLVARNLPPNALGLVFFGPLTTQVPLGDGFRCIGAGLHRLPVEVADGSGVLAHDVDFSTWPGSLVTAGRTWNFQALHRDPGSTGTGLNLTNALAVRITP